MNVVQTPREVVMIVFSFFFSGKVKMIFIYISLDDFICFSSRKSSNCSGSN